MGPNQDHWWGSKSSHMFLPHQLAFTLKWPAHLYAIKSLVTSPIPDERLKRKHMLALVLLFEGKGIRPHPLRVLVKLPLPPADLAFYSNQFHQYLCYFKPTTQACQNVIYANNFVGTLTKCQPTMICWCLRPTTILTSGEKNILNLALWAVHATGFALFLKLMV